MKRYCEIKRKIALIVVLALSVFGYASFIINLNGTHQEGVPNTHKEYLLPFASDLTTFSSVWDTTVTSSGSSNSSQVRLPLESSGTYSFSIDWGDGSNEVITGFNPLTSLHNYTTSGLYTINITGTIVGWRFNNGGDRNKLQEIKQWGNLRLGNSGEYFYGCENLEITAIDTLDLTGTTNLQSSFRECYNLGTTGDFNSWNVSSVTDMSYMFHQASSFNQPLNNWDVSGVLNMEGMFWYASSFNQPLNTWDVSKVTNMNILFGYASSFNESLENWDFSSITEIAALFYYASSFNQPLNTWEVSSLTNLDSMFSKASSFNQPLDNWNVSSATDMSSMFSGASSFNQPLNNWNVSGVNDMSSIFVDASSFNQPLNNWNVSSVIDMNSMFANATSFNQPLNNWNVSSVTDMTSMFYLSSSFNQPLNNWDVSSVTDMWGMFFQASSFNQPLNNWDVTKVTRMDIIFNGLTLSTEYYDEMLVEWSQLSLSSGVQFDAGNSEYSSVAVNSRANIISTYSWTITDGGYNPNPAQFTLSSDADSPDRDGSFTLTWASSYGANNYTVYQHSGYITSINGSVTVIANEIGDLSESLNDISHGTYYYIIAANNDFGSTLSNCIEVVVDLTPGGFALTTDATNPDSDGNFNLIWTVSDRATAYNVYQYSSFIGEINGSVTLIASEINEITLELSEHTNGSYYFIVEAINAYETSQSNCIHIIVGIQLTLIIITPSSADSWEPGTIQLIHWNSTGSIANVKLQLYQGDGFVMEIISSTSNTGEFFWVIPSALLESDNYQIKISDVSFPEVFDFSEYFEIRTRKIPGYNIPVILGVLGIIVIVFVKKKRIQK